MRVRTVLTWVALALVARTGFASASERPVAVSPGSATRALIGDACPTFSWGEVDGARSYQLVVYQFGEEDEEAQPVLRQRIPGSANGWTPA